MDRIYSAPARYDTTCTWACIMEAPGNEILITPTYEVQVGQLARPRKVVCIPTTLLRPLYLAVVVGSLSSLAGSS